MTLPRVLTIMGSGETAPTMVTTHRQLVSRLPAPVKAVVLDTPYGFQENAPELAARAVEYFNTSVNITLQVAGLSRLVDTHIPADPVQVERGLRMLVDSDYVFAGPGSPTYALRQWQGSQVGHIITEKLRSGGIVTFASAAALTLGRSTVPVYEIYKVGQDVQRLDGLDVLGAIGVNAAVIPHYDNAEGGHHDTRFCYLGEARLQVFESMLGSDTYVLGVDEHTGLVIDIDQECANVVGNGTVTIRLRGVSRSFATGDTIPLALLQDPWTSDHSSHSPSHSHGAHQESASGPPTAQGSKSGTGASLAADTDRTMADFDTAMDNRDAQGAVRAALALEASIRAWSADTLQSDEADRAHAALRSMISRLGDAATSGVRNPRDVFAPFVEAMLQVRSVVRAEKRYDLSDVIRDVFASLNIEVRDTPDGVVWELNS